MMTFGPSLIPFSNPENADPTCSKFGSSHQQDSQFRCQHMPTVISWRTAALRQELSFGHFMRARWYNDRFWMGAYATGPTAGAICSRYDGQWQKPTGAANPAVRPCYSAVCVKREAVSEHRQSAFRLG